MTDVSELVGRLRRGVNYEDGECDIEGAEHVMSLAADALETLAGEVEELETELECVKKQRDDYFYEYRKKVIEYLEMKIVNAKLVPVVEAARVLKKSEGSNMWGAEEWGAWDAMIDALATLEAAHD